MSKGIALLDEFTRVYRHVPISDNLNVDLRPISPGEGVTLQREISAVIGDREKEEGEEEVSDIEISALCLTYCLSKVNGESVAEETEGNCIDLSLARSLVFHAGGYMGELSLQSLRCCGLGEMADRVSAALDSTIPYMAKTGDSPSPASPSLQAKHPPALSEGDKTREDVPLVF